MKKLFLLFALSLLMTACDNFNNPQQGDNSSNNSEYYVRYSISSSFYKFGNISYADINGTGRAHEGNYSNTSTKWSITIGPVKHGFNAFVRYDSGRADVVKIEISKNNSPFAEKASGSNSASYRINY